MPRHCITAGCDINSGKGYSFHKFPKDDTSEGGGLAPLIKWQQNNWDGSSKDSQLCSKHFEEDLIYNRLKG